MESDAVFITAAMTALFVGYDSRYFLRDVLHIRTATCVLNATYSDKLSDFMLTASLFNEAASTINYSCYVLSGFRRLIIDIGALVNVKQHRLIVTDCLTLEDGTGSLFRNVGNYQSICVSAQKSEYFNDVLVARSKAFPLNSRLFSVD
jgi:hypothetical protein